MPIYDIIKIYYFIYVMKMNKVESLKYLESVLQKNGVILRKL